MTESCGGTLMDWKLLEGKGWILCFFTSLHIIPLPSNPRWHLTAHRIECPSIQPSTHPPIHSFDKYSLSAMLGMWKYISTKESLWGRKQLQNRVVNPMQKEIERLWGLEKLYSSHDWHFSCGSLVNSLLFLCLSFLITKMRIIMPTLRGCRSSINIIELLETLKKTKISEERYYV